MTSIPNGRRLRVRLTRFAIAVAAISLVPTALAASPAVAATPPENDAFAAATALDGPLPVTVAGTNVDATSEPGEPLDGDTMSGSVWYRWTAPSAARVVVEACAESFEAHLGVYVGSTAQTQVLVQEGLRPFDFPCGLRTSVSFVPTAGTTYNIAVRGYEGQRGAFDLTVRPPAAANDDFSAAEVVPAAVPASASAFTEEATKELGEPSHAGDVGGRSVWYAWTPASSAEVAVSTCGSDFDTLLAVYTGTAVDDLIVVAANDDDPDQCGNGRQSRLVLAVTAGTTYMVAVDGWSASFGNLALSITSSRPVNDDFVAAEVVTGALPLSTTGANVAATQEPGEPDPGPVPGGRSVWFDWTPDVAGLVSVTTCDSSFVTNVAVFTGDDVTTLTDVGGGNSRCGRRGAATFVATPGTTYHVRVDGAGGATGAIALQIGPADPPANDDFADAATLAGALPIATAGSNIDATLEPGEPGLDAVPGGSVWFAWTPAVDDLVQIQTCGGDGQSVIAIYTGTSLSDLEAVAANSFGCAFGSTVTLDVEAATTYWIVVAGYAEGTFELTIAPATRPANDAFADAETIGPDLPVTVDGTNVAATREQGEPAHAGFAGDTSVWYRLTPAVSTQVTIDTCGSGFDTMLAVYTGSTVSDLDVVASNDDRCGRNSEVTFQATAGTTYAIAVVGWHDAQGSFELTLTPTNRPPNDDFEDAQLLTGELPIVGVTGTNVEATLEPGEPQDGDGGSSSVWYRYTPEESGVYLLASCASTFPLDIDVYTGAAVGALTLVPGRPDDFDCGSDQDAFELTAGVTYAIAVDGRFGGTGDFRFGLFLEDPPANDDFADAEVVEGPLPVTVTGTTSDATTEPGEPDHSGDPADGASVWFRWTPTETAWVAVDGGDGCSLGATFQQYAVYTGSSVAALTPLAGRACEGDGTIHFRAVEGTTYHIAVQAELGIAIDFPLTIRELDRPANDDLADAAAVRGRLPRVVEGNLLDGTLEPGEPHSSLPSTLATVWYEWTAPATGPVTIESCGSAFTTHLAVFSGGDVDDLTLVAAENQACGLNGSATFDATRGSTYVVQVTGSWRHQGPIRLTFRMPVRPPNDGFAGARQLAATDPIVVRDSNVDATREPGEPLHAGEGGGSSLWYRWTAPTTGEYRIDTCDSGVFGTQLAVYTGSRLDALTTVAADGDDCPSGRHGEVTFLATAGTTYRIAVDAEHGEQGSIELHVRRSRRGPNDDFAGALVVAGPLPIVVTGSSLDATPEPGEPLVYNGGFGTNASAVWYRWTALTTEVVSVESCGSGFESQVGVFTGGAVASLVQVPSADSECDGGRRAEFGAVAGTTYQIAVDGYFLASASTGPIQLTIRATERPANDDLADAVALSGPLPISVAGDNRDATSEAGEPSHAPVGGAPRRTVWYSWTADSDGAVVFDACGAEFDALLAVWVGPAVDQLSRRPADVPLGVLGGTCEQQRLELDAEAGTTYHIAIDGQGGAQGAFDLTIRRPQRPANDDFEAAQRLSGPLPIAVTVDVTDATAQQPVEALLVSNVWFQWTARTNRPVVIDGCDAGYTLELDIFTGPALDSLEEVDVEDGGCNSWRFAPTRGSTYWISASDSGATGMPATFQIRELDPPANDDFRRAEVISALGAQPLTIAGDLRDATTEPGEPRHAGATPSGSVWYRYTPRTSGVVSFDTCGGGFSDVLAVYTGPALNQLVRVTDGGTGGTGTCGIRVRGAKVAFLAQAGTTYFIAVQSDEGRVQLHATSEAEPGPRRVARVRSRWAWILELVLGVRPVLRAPGVW